MDFSPLLGSLADVRVIDLTRVLGGPYCTQLLGDHGAEIIKIEPPGGDETRGWGPPFKDGLSAYFSGVNRNKIAWTLSDRSEGQQIVCRLLEGDRCAYRELQVGNDGRRAPALGTASSRG